MKIDIKQHESDIRVAKGAVLLADIVDKWSKENLTYMEMLRVLSDMESRIIQYQIRAELKGKGL